MRYLFRLSHRASFLNSRLNKEYIGDTPSPIFASQGFSLRSACSGIFRGVLQRMQTTLILRNILKKERYIKIVGGRAYICYKYVWYTSMYVIRQFNILSTWCAENIYESYIKLDSWRVFLYYFGINKIGGGSIFVVFVFNLLHEFTSSTKTNFEELIFLLKPKTDGSTKLHPHK